MKVNQLKTGAILSYVILILGSVISIVYTPVMLRLLGQTQYGLYSLSSSFIGYLGVLDFGFGNAIVRYNSKYRALGDKEGQYNLNGMFITIYSLLAILIAIAGFILVLNAGSLFSKSMNQYELSQAKILMGLMVFNLAISLPFSIFGSIIIAHERFVFQKVINLATLILNPLIMLPLLLMGYKSVSIVLLSIVLNIFSIIVNIVYCYKILHIKIWFKKFDISLFKEILGYSFFIFLGIIVDKIFWNTDQIVLGIICGPIVVAVYAVGAQFNYYYMSFSTAISGIFLPKITAMVFKEVSNEEISDLFIKTGRIQYIIIAFVLSGFMLFGRSFINIWAGPNYDSAFFIAIVIMIPLTIPLIQGLGLPILQAKNMQAFRSVVYIGIAILNVIASVYLAKIWGGFGCALASALAFLLGHGVIMNIYYYKKIHINIPLFWKDIGMMTIPVVIAFIMGLGINYIISTNSMLTILIKGILFTTCYIPLMYFIAMSEYEKNIFARPLIKLFLKKR